MSQADLRQALKFTTEDLSANQRGALSPAQSAYLRGLQKRAVQWTAVVFVLFVLLATGFLFLGVQQNSGIATFIGMFITTLNAISMGIFARHYMRLRADLLGEKVEQLEGELTRIIRPLGQVNNYVVRVAGIDFGMTKDLFKHFEHQAHYVFYRTPHSHLLLSAEKRKG
jgi:hypothetical protein